MTSKSSNTNASKWVVDAANQIVRSIVDQIDRRETDKIAVDPTIIESAAFRQYAPLIGELLDHLLTWAWESGDIEKNQWLCPVCGCQHHNMEKAEHDDDCELGDAIRKAARVVGEPKL